MLQLGTAKTTVFALKPTLFAGVDIGISSTIDFILIVQKTNVKNVNHNREYSTWFFGVLAYSTYLAAIILYSYKTGYFP